MQNETETKPNGRQALGRGLAEIGEQNPPRIEREQAQREAKPARRGWRIWRRK